MLAGKLTNLKTINNLCKLKLMIFQAQSLLIKKKRIKRDYYRLKFLHLLLLRTVMRLASEVKLQQKLLIQRRHKKLMNIKTKTKCSDLKKKHRQLQSLQ